MKIVSHLVSVVSFVAALSGSLHSVQASRYSSPPDDFTPIAGELSARNGGAAFSEAGLHGVLIAPRVAVVTNHAINNAATQANNGQNRIRFYGQDRTIAAIARLPNAGLGSNDLALILLNQPIDNVRCAAIYGFNGENINDLVGKWGTSYSRNKVYRVNSEAQIFPNEKKTHMGRVHFSQLLGNELHVGLPNGRPNGSFGNAAVEDNRKVVPVAGDSGSPVYYFHQGVLKLVGLVSTAHGLEEMNLAGGAGSYTLLAGHMNFINNHLQFVAQNGIFQGAPAVPPLLAAAPADQQQDRWRNFCPSNAAYYPFLNGAQRTPVACCEKFLAEFPDAAPASLRQIRRDVEGMMQWAHQRGREDIRFFWRRIRDNIDHATANWDAMGRDFVNMMTSTMYNPTLTGLFGQQYWSEERAKNSAKAIFSLLHGFSSLSSRDKMLVLLEWRYHILPSIQMTRDWMNEVRDQRYLDRMDAIYNACPAHLENAVSNIEAYRTPVRDIKKYMAMYLEMLLDFRAGGQCLITTNSNMDHFNYPGEYDRFVIPGRRFNWISIPIRRPDGTHYNTTWLQPDFCNQTWRVNKFDPALFIDAFKGFVLLFLRAHEAFQQAGQLNTYYRDVISTGAAGTCLNYRTRNISEAYLLRLPQLQLMAQNNNNNNNNDVIQVESSTIVVARLTQIWNLNNEQIENPNLHNILIQHFRVGSSNPVRGINGPVTVDVIKEAIRYFVQTTNGNQLELSGIHPNVYYWATH